MNKSQCLSFTVVIFLIFTAFTYPKTYPDDCLDDLKVPQKFTPNGDDILDIFTINFPCPPESCEIKIFDNVSGELVFVSKTHQFEWNGLREDTLQACSSGIYDWKLSYMYHMTYSERKGQVLLLR